MKRLLLLIALSTNLAFAQNFEWAKSIGSAGDDRANVIKLDASGNIYVAGAFKGTVDFNPGAATNSLTSAGGFDLFVAKYDPTGNFLWANKGGTILNEFVLAMAIDNNGDVVITGYGALNASGSQRAMFVAKANSSGVEQWNHTFTSGGNHMGGYALATDDNNNVYIGGNFAGLVDFDPGTGVTDSVSQGSDTDAYILKLNPLGEFGFVKVFSSYNASDNIFGITVDGFGNIYSTGQCWSSLDCDPGLGTAYIGYSGNGDAFVSKLDNNGNYVWGKKIGGSGTEFGSSITVDASGNVITTGFFEDTADFEPGSGTSNLISSGGRDIYVSKLDSNGDYVWAKKMGAGNYDKGNSVATDASGNVYTTGFYQDTVDFDPGSGTSNLVSNLNSIDIFVQKLNPNGDFVWAHSIGSVEADYGTSILLDGSDNIYFTGYYDGTVDLDPSSAENNFTTEGGNDFFFVKWNQSNVGIEENTLSNSLKLYPNPTTSTFQINGLKPNSKVELFNALGEVQKVTQTNNLFNIEDLNDGIYFVRVKNGNETQTFRIIKK